PSTDRGVDTPRSPDTMTTSLPRRAPMFQPRHDPAADLPAPHATFPRLALAPVSPFVSVIVPVRNEAVFITKTLCQLLEQDYERSRFEVIVADGESTDATAALVRALQGRYANLHLVSNPGRWSSAGRNAALEVSRGEIVVVIDGHCDVNNPHHLADLADAFERSGADCLGRPQPQDLSGATTLQQAIAACRGSRLG